MFQEVDAFDAQAKLSELLSAVSQGQCYTITLRGKPIADLVPSNIARRPGVEEAISALQAFPRLHGVCARDVCDMITQGRR